MKVACLWAGLKFYLLSLRKTTFEAKKQQNKSMETTYTLTVSTVRKTGETGDTYTRFATVLNLLGGCN